MKQIKTIVIRLNNAYEFDTDVNKALQDGWTLTERKVLPPPSHPLSGTYFDTLLYAELERFTEPDECEDNPFCNLVENCARFIGNLADRNAENDPARKCADCKHVSCNIDEQPCRDCIILRHWEPKT